MGKALGQIAVASFDDQPFATPSLTIICQPMGELSKLLLELLVNNMNQEELAVSKDVYPHVKYWEIVNLC
ncbi:hypothetical protein KSX_58630 [Ktedonospora formicarum]|uniref:Uncharacterized protein n=1 Tax=Ktedonospora formicarum TaxID=2778364 RepID=A0A8J3I6D3_9CHLR|nr:hypothetical protein KSX_58630 [Ktedonospora formicarum]